jgi:hypothetical protein
MDDLDEDISFIQIEDAVVTYPDWNSEVINPGESSYNIRARYGTDEHMIDVTKELLFCFKSYDELVILRNYVLNDYFGDPVPNQVKKLVIEINGKTHIFNEYRNLDIYLWLDSGDVLVPKPSVQLNSPEIITI